MEIVSTAGFGMPLSGAQAPLDVAQTIIDKYKSRHSFTMHLHFSISFIYLSPNGTVSGRNGDCLPKMGGGILDDGNSNKDHGCIAEFVMRGSHIGAICFHLKPCKQKLSFCFIK